MTQAENTQDVQAPDAPQGIAADKPVKQKKARVRKDPGTWKETTPDTSYKLPVMDTSVSKTGLRRAVTESGAFDVAAVSYLTTREVRALLLGVIGGEELKLDMRGYGVDAKGVTTLDKALEVATKRAKVWADKERVRSEARRVQREKTLGEAATEIGSGTDVMRRVLEGRVLVPAKLDGDGRGIINTLADLDEERVYDIDGRAGRRRFYTFVDEAQLKADGTPRARAELVYVSETLWAEVIKGDAEFEAHFKVPATFDAPKVKAPKAKAPAKPKATKDKAAPAPEAPAVEDTTEATPAPEATPAQPPAPAGLEDLLA